MVPDALRTCDDLDGQTHDRKMAGPMLKDIGKDAIILADRAYDTNALFNRL
jgi:hypothetical protein